MDSWRLSVFKIKFPIMEKEIIKQTLGIEEGITYDIVLCHDFNDQEEDKINLVFKIENLEKVKDKIQFFQNTSPIYMYGKTHRGEVKIMIKDIDYIESFGNEIIAYLENREVRLTLRLYELLEQLDPFGFYRISKSLIVNITKISAVKSAFNGKLTITLSDKKELEVNRSYVKAFKNYLKGR